TLTLQQMFPSLEYTDALTEAETLVEALDLGHQQLANDRNTPAISFPIATAPVERFSRTGRPSVRMSALAQREDDGLNEVDIDTDLHRQAYQSMNMREAAALQDKFTPEDLKGTLHYPLDLETDFLFDDEQHGAPDSDPSKDISLIHIDGNGLGILLMRLKNALKNKSDAELRKGFRQFSRALNQATTVAAKAATQYIYDKACYRKDTRSSDSTQMIPMRPIVLGGDDITLLCRANLALEFSTRFCNAFMDASKDKLSPLFDDFGFPKEYERYLTASGGILYQKASHPFTHSHQLVEALCAQAKKRTKSVVDEGAIGPAALAFHRQSESTNDSFDILADRTLVHGDRMQMGQTAYFVDSSTQAHARLAQAPFELSKLKRLVAYSASAEQADTAMPPVSIARWRQMATAIAQGDIDEADIIYHRGLSLAATNQKKALEELLDNLTPDGYQRQNWYWVNQQTGEQYCLINDLLVLHHFAEPMKGNSHTNDKEVTHG
ncbi:Cas10/Cmr2 second palm domain-containing protein, partial [Salinivibrio sp. PR919]